jgi:hypothetical protein
MSNARLIGAAPWALALHPDPDKTTERRNRILRAKHNYKL